MRQGAFTQSGLVAYAERLGVPEKTAVLNPKIGGHKEVLCADRLADRLIQKHRKAGNIVRSVDDRGVAREWFWQEKVPLA